MVLEDKYCNFKRHFHQILNIRQAQHWEIVPHSTHTPNKSVTAKLHSDYSFSLHCQMYSKNPSKPSGIFIISHSPREN